MEVLGINLCPSLTLTGVIYETVTSREVTNSNDTMLPCPTQGTIIENRKDLFSPRNPVPLSPSSVAAAYSRRVQLPCHLIH